ncbi:MAG TPA: winged helix-turn-helix domain-containing protein [Candidatus Dormibacteraeota bacterium]|jgi:DNA-binding response OmpR family regulator|nr:winged helix-turn-helix domain-containing protein [Candidatus Dormibacteraeota bacterium]
MAEQTERRPSVPLEGEDLKTEHWEDARHWLSVYADLLQFKRGLLKRVERDIQKLPEPAQQAAATDLAIIENQMEGYLERIELWYQRVWDLQGLWIDPEGRVLRHQGREAVLTRREYQLLAFLLKHPHRYFSAAQILAQAWADPALYPEEVRNYVQRLRKILKRLDVPCQVLNRPGQGYALVFAAP